MTFSSLAGYDIRESVKIWERMKEAHKGKEPPEWMSTHPSSTKRIEALKKWIPEVILEYPPIKKRRHKKRRRKKIKYSVMVGR